MAKSTPGNKPHRTSADTSQAVDAFMAVLEHEFKGEIQLLRDSMLGVDDSISEGIKWNSPSYRTTEYFATTNLREKAGIGMILHLGAKVRELPPGGIQISDPRGLLRWVANDRASIVFKNAADFEDKKDAFENIIRQWISHV